MSGRQKVKIIFNNNQSKQENILLLLFLKKKLIFNLFLFKTCKYSRIK